MTTGADCKCSCHAYAGLSVLCNFCSAHHGSPKVNPEAVERNDPWRPEQLEAMGSGFCQQCGRLLDGHEWDMSDSPSWNAPRCA